MIKGAIIQQNIPRVDNLPSIPTNINLVEVVLEIPTGITLTQL